MQQENFMAMTNRIDVSILFMLLLAACDGVRDNSGFTDRVMIGNVGYPLIRYEEAFENSNSNRAPEGKI
jgi:hypothetical protein